MILGCTSPKKCFIFVVWLGRFAPAFRAPGVVAVNRSSFSGRKDWDRTFWSNYRDRMECGRILSYLLYGSVASLPSPSSNIEAWPYGTSLRFAPAFRALGVCEHIWLRYKNFDPSCFDPIQKFGIVDLRTNSDFRTRSFDLFLPTPPGVCEHSWLREIGKFILKISERTSFRSALISQSDCR